MYIKPVNWLRQTVLLSIVLIYSLKAVSLTLTYDVTYLPHEKKIQFELSFKNQKADGQFLLLPNAWGGHQQLYKQVDILSIKGGQLYPTKYPYVKKIVSKPNEVIKIKYQVKQGFEGEPRTPLQGRQPIIQDQYFHFIGTGAFIYPMIDKSKKIDIHLNWNLPVGWEVANSFSAKSYQQSFKASISDLLLGIYLAGNYRLYQTFVNKNPVWLALRGQLRFTDNAMKRTVALALKTERDFWPDNNFPYFMVSVFPVGSNKHVISGLGLTNAFASFVPPSRGIDRSFSSLLMHETFHYWNTPSLFKNGAYQQESKYWFTEGFTDYYAEILALRGGLIKLVQYINHYNSIVDAYYNSPVKNLHNSKLPKLFWKNYHIQELPYQRGNLFAHYLNAEIKAASKDKHSLDDAIKEMILIKNDNHFQKNVNANDDHYHSESDYLTYKTFHHVVKKYWPEYNESDFNHWIIEGKDIPIHPMALGPCANLIEKEKKQMNFGFDAKASVAKGSIQNVVKGSQAHQSGLRNGQILKDLQYNIQQPQRPVTVVIEDNNKSIRKISYQASLDQVQKVPFYQLNMKKISLEPETCLKWFGVN